MKKIEIEISDETECVANSRLRDLIVEYGKPKAYGMLMDETVAVAVYGSYLYPFEYRYG